jgi:hypothetical protein
VKTVGVIAGVVMFAAVALPQDNEQRAKLSGAWELQDAANGQDSRGWSFEPTGDSIHVVHTLGGRTVADFECNTVGKECEIKESGHKAKVALWYSGPKLIELETKGSDVLKRRFAVQGDAMEMEKIPVVPTGSAETLKFKRGQMAARSN